MRQLTEDDVRGAFANAGDEELRLLTLPADFMLTDWDHQDFFAWRDPRSRGRAGTSSSSPDGGRARRGVVRAAEGTSRARVRRCATSAIRRSRPIR